MTGSITTRACVGVTALALASSAFAATDNQYAQLRDALVEAIDQGSAYGVLRDALADKLTTQLHANGPVYVSATPIGSLNRTGCKRLDVVFDVRGVQTPQGETTGTLDLKMNYCRDGVPPIGLTIAGGAAAGSVSGATSGIAPSTVNANQQKGVQ